MARVVGVGSPNWIILGNCTDEDEEEDEVLIMLDGKIVKSYTRLGLSRCLYDELLVFVVEEDLSLDAVSILSFVLSSFSSSPPKQKHPFSIFFPRLFMEIV